MSLTTLAVTPGSGFNIAHDSTASGNDQIVKVGVPILGSVALERSYDSAASLTFRAGAQTLASSTTVGEISDPVDFTQLPYRAQWLEFKFKTAAGSPTGAVTFYGLPSLDGSVWPGDVAYAGAAAAYTLSGASNTGLLKTLWTLTPYSGNTTHTYVVSLNDISTGYTVPPHLAVAVINHTNLAFSQVSVRYLGSF